MAKNPQKTKAFFNKFGVSIAVLVVICLVCGVLLALCNDLLYITEDEKFNRTLAKIYPGFQKDDSFAQTPDAKFATNAQYGQINNVYKAKDGTAYILESTGTGGFSGGSVTINIAVTSDGVIKGWTILDNKGQSFIANITDKHSKTWYKDVSVGGDIDASTLKGTTYTSVAIHNAVLMAQYYCVNALRLVSTPDSEALDAVNAFVAEKLATELQGYAIAHATDATYAAALTEGDASVAFYLTATKAGAKTYSIYVCGDIDAGHSIAVVDDSATSAARLDGTAVVAKSDDFDGALLTKIAGYAYADHLVRASHAGFVFNGETVFETAIDTATATINNVYTSTDGATAVIVTGKGGFGGGTITLCVVVKDNVILACNHVSNVGQSFWGGVIKQDNLNSFYVNKNIATDNLEISGTTVGGATLTSTAANNAVNAVADYVKSIAE